MSEKKYPTRMHEVLGVATEERFTYREYGDRKFWLSESGLMYRICDDGTSIPTTQGTLVLFINHPERILRKPRLSEEQVKQLGALVTLGFRWLAKQRKGCVMFFQKKPHKNAIWFSGTGGEQEDYGVVLPNDTHLSSLVSWSDPAPLDIVQTLRDAGVEVDDA